MPEPSCPIKAAFRAAPAGVHSLRPAVRAWAGIWTDTQTAAVNPTGSLAVALVNLQSDVEVERQTGERIVAPIGATIVAASGHTLRIAARRPSQVLGIAFDEALLRTSVLPMLGREPGAYRLVQNGVSRASVITGIAQTLAHALLDPSTPSGGAGSALIIALLEAVAGDPILATRSPPPSTFVEKCTERALRFIDENLAQEIRLTIVARAAGSSPCHLSRCFSESMGQPLSDYVRERRLQAACRMLVETRMSLVDVALACGFSSQSAMNALFRKRLNCTPLEHRRRAWRLPVKQESAFAQAS